MFASGQRLEPSSRIS